MIDRPSSTSVTLAALCALVSACAAAPGPGEGHPNTGALTRLRILAASAVPLAGPMPLAPCAQAPPTPTAGPSAPGYGCERAIVSGTVFDPAGAPAEGAVVVARSLDPSVPYSATAATAGGVWVVNNFPQGANVEVFAYGDAWITPRHVIAAECGRRNTLELRAEIVYALGDDMPEPVRLAE